MSSRDIHSAISVIADLSRGNPQDVRTLYCFMSDVEAKAFFRLNWLKLGTEIALISLGGKFSEQQVRESMRRFPNSRLVDCFSNDLSGRINGLRLLSVAENLPMMISRCDDGVIVHTCQKIFKLQFKTSLVKEIGKYVRIKSKFGQWLPPKNFNKWSDVLIGKRIGPEFIPNKYDRNNRLAEQRKKL
jgi:hypothetical protein